MATTLDDKSIPDRLALSLYLSVLIVSPWLLGSNRDWAWPAISIVVYVLALLLLFRHLPLKRPARLSLWCLVLTAVWLLIQLTGIPLVVESLTIDPTSTRDDLLKTITYLAFAYCTLQLAREPGTVELIIYTVVLTALLQALVGGAQVFYFDDVHARGSFPNRNHYACYLVIALTLGIGLMIARMKGSSGSGWLDNFVDVITGPQARLRLMLVIIVIGLVLTRSRGGNLAFLISIMFAGGLGVFLTRQLNRKVLLFLVSLVALDMVIIGSYFGVERLAARIQATSLAGESRDELNGYSVRIFRDHWLSGTGSGTYEYAFARYRGADVSARVSNAENEYLEFLVELGVIGVVPMVLLLWLTIGWQLRSQYRDADPWRRGISLGCLMGTLAVLVHSAVEFNLQIPAIALLFILLLFLPLALGREAKKQKVKKGPDVYSQGIEV